MSARGVAIASLVAAVSVPAFAQTGPPKPEVTPIAEHGSVRPGQTARVAVRVSVPAGFHLQSNKPRDPLLIPTVLAIDAPAGVTVSAVDDALLALLRTAGDDAGSAGVWAAAAAHTNMPATAIHQ